MEDKKLIEGEVEERRDAHREMTEEAAQAEVEAVAATRAPIIDASQVYVMVGSPDGNMVPMRLPDVFNQLFRVFGDFERRLNEIEAKEERRLILPN